MGGQRGACNTGVQTDVIRHTTAVQTAEDGRGQCNQVICCGVGLTIVQASLVELEPRSIHTRRPRIEPLIFLRGHGGRPRPRILADHRDLPYGPLRTQDSPNSH